MSSDFFNEKWVQYGMVAIGFFIIIRLLLIFVARLLELEGGILNLFAALLSGLATYWVLHRRF